MVLKLVRGLLRRLTALITQEEPTFIHLTLQRDDAENRRLSSAQPCLFNAFLDLVDGASLELDFLESLDHEPPALTIDYAPGDEIPESLVPAGTASRLRDALIEGNGRPFSLVVVAPGIPAHDFYIGSIFFRHEGGMAFRARPIYVFIDARDRGLA